MHLRTLDILACPSCRSEYQLVSHAGSDSHVERGFLRCESCAIVIPIIDGFTFFTEPLLHEGLASAEALEAMSQALFGSAEDFAVYAQDKQARKLIESYAAFHPFNESTRALNPLLPHVRPVLQEADFVLDCWARTGWSGEWLAGLLPAQHIVSIWEGNTSVLGYRGYRRLLGTPQRAENLDVIFTHPERPLPFRDQAFGFTYAVDSLHRYALFPFAGETLRVTRRDGALIHAHIHLSNSEPEPFFERGCRYAHGRDYRAWLDRITAGDERRGFVMSEGTLFDGPVPAVLEDDCDTAHYNGLIAVLPPTAPVTADQTASAHWRYLVNPLFRIRLGRGTASYAAQQFDGAAGHLIERHPIYAARLHQPAVLDELATLGLLLTAAGMDHAALLAVLPEEAAVMATSLQTLCRSELLLAAPVSKAAHALQGFHTNQHLPEIGQALAAIWRRLQQEQSPMLSLADGAALSGADLADFAARIPAYLHGSGLRPGDWLAIRVNEHPLLWIAALSAVTAGFHVHLAGGADATRRDVKLHLHGDEPDDSAHGVALGLDGRAGSLLDRLATIPAGAGAGSGRAGLVEGRVEGLIELETVQGRAVCSLEALAAGCAALHGQLERQIGMIEGRSLLRDLLTLLVSLSAGERLHLDRAITAIQPPADESGDYGSQPGSR